MTRIGFAQAWTRPVLLVAVVAIAGVGVLLATSGSTPAQTAGPTSTPGESARPAETTPAASPTTPAGPTATVRATTAARSCPAYEANGVTGTDWVPIFAHDPGSEVSMGPFLQGTLNVTAGSAHVAGTERWVIALTKPEPGPWPVTVRWWGFLQWKDQGYGTGGSVTASFTVNGQTTTLTVTSPEAATPVTQVFFDVPLTVSDGDLLDLGFVADLTNTDPAREVELTGAIQGLRDLEIEMHQVPCET